VKTLETLAFNSVKCAEELRELGDLLAQHAELDERKQIQPFFESRKHLSAFIGSFFPDLLIPNRVGFQLSIGGDFVADAVAGNFERRTYCLIEFEDARPDSIFRRLSRSMPEWGSRFEHGFSQVVDWFYRLDDLRRTDQFVRVFGDGSVKFFGMLVLGRSSALSEDDRSRLWWRTNKVTIDSNWIDYRTFDDLHLELTRKLEDLRSASSTEREST
jgi:Domain of unknown function (DUF4263)